MSSNNKLIEISGELIPPFETELAYHFFNGDKTVWLPKSQCEWNEEDSEMTLPAWLGLEKGLI